MSATRSRQVRLDGVSTLIGVVLTLLVSAAVAATPADAAFPGGNGRIVFDSDRDANREIYSTSPDGLSQKRLTVDAGNDSVPSVSPDGSKVVFSSNRDGDTEVYIMSVAGGSATKLTSNGTGDEDPVFSADGTSIIFESNRDANWNIYTMSLTGAGQTALTVDGGMDTDPSVSRNGAIVFTSDRGGNLDVFRMQPDGSAQTAVTTDGGADFDPVVSPDGSRVAFATNRHGDVEIYSKPLAGGAELRLTTNVATDSDPAYSPDGRKIAFETNRDGNFEIYTMAAADGASPTNVTQRPASSDVNPDWQRVDATRPVASFRRSRCGRATAGIARCRLRGVASDDGVLPSGVSRVQVNVTRRLSRTRCLAFNGRRWRRMSCSRAGNVWIAARVSGNGWSRVVTGVAVGARNYRSRVRATDEAGNVQSPLVVRRGRF